MNLPGRPTADGPLSSGQPEVDSISGPLQYRWAAAAHSPRRSDSRAAPVVGDGKWLAFIAYQDDGNQRPPAINVSEDAVLNLTDTSAEESDPNGPRTAGRSRSRTHGYKGQRAERGHPSGMVRNSPTRPHRIFSGRPTASPWYSSRIFFSFATNAGDEDIFIIPAEGGHRACSLRAHRIPRYLSQLGAGFQTDRLCLRGSGFSNLYILDTQSGARQTLTSGTVVSCPRNGRRTETWCCMYASRFNLPCFRITIPMAKWCVVRR